MTEAQYTRNSYFDPLNDPHTLEEVEHRIKQATRLSDEWWLCIAWHQHYKTGEWAPWVTEYGEVDRNELREEIEGFFPNRPDLLHNPDAANVPLPLRLEVLYEQEGCCAECGTEEWRLKKRLHAHRIRPGRLGGKYIKGNVKLLCGPCHRKAPEHRGKRKQ